MVSARFVNRLAAFKSDLHGSTSMIFGLSVVPIMLMVAAGLDYSNAIQQKSQLQQATDATALAVTRNMTATSTPATLLAQAQKFLAAAVDDPNAIITSGPTISSNNTALCISTRTTSRATMMQAAVGMGFAPQSVLTVSGNSCTKINDVTYEVAMVLDNSGSMLEATSGTTKIQSLQTAASQMVSTLNPVASAPRASFSIVPFSSAVKIGAGYQNAAFMDTAGKSSIHWQNFQLPTRASWLPASKFDLYAGLGTSAKPVTWAGCVEERPDPYMTTDTAASTSVPDTLFVPYLYPDIHTATYSRSAKKYIYDSSTNSYINLDSNGEAGNCTQNDVYDQADASATQSSTPVKNTGSSAVANTVWDATQTKVCKYKGTTSAGDLLTGSSAFGSGFNVGPNLLCDSQAVTTLSNDNAVLTAAIQSLSAKGDTNILGGVMWGWRTISPNGPFNTQTTATGAIGNQNAKAYPTSGSSAVTNVKVMIVMTDGMNHWSNISTSSDPNGSAYNSLGFYNNDRLGNTTASNFRSLMDAKTLEACTNAKAAGIQVYTVGFSIPSDPIDSIGLALLQNCASKANMAYVAQDGSALITTFQQIAQNMSGLRLTH